MDKKEKIATLLAQGISPANAASYSGVSLPYISQLVKDKDFQELIKTKMVEVDTTKTDEEILTTKYESMEHRLLRAMEDNLPSADFREITNALKVIGDRQNAREKRKIPANMANTTNVMVVQVALPKQIIPSLTVNDKNEVIAIDNQPMAPMTSQGVASLFQRLNPSGDRRNAKLEVYDESGTQAIPISASRDF